MLFLKSSFFLLLFALALNASMLMRTKVQLGTFVTITLEEKDKALFSPAFKIIDNVENSLSSYKNSATVFRLNKNKNVLLDSYTYEALTLSRWYYKKTDGYFNIAIGSVTKGLYHFGEDEVLPNEKALKETSLALETLTYSSSNARMSKTTTIDLGGMGKGFAVDKVAEYLQLQGIKKATIAASGDIRCLNTCKIEINNPFSDKALFSFVTRFKDMGISTSGNYNRYIKDKTHNHLINPKTKESQRNFISITLISKLPSADLDAYATAASVMPREKAFAFLNSMGIAFVILDSEKELHLSGNLEEFVNIQNVP